MFPYQNPYIPYQVQPQQNGIIWVNSDEEAFAYPIAPNNAVRLWHSSQPVVYFKSADASGRPSIKAYNLVERTQSASPSVSPADGKVTEYATKSEIEALSREIETLKAKLKGAPNE